MALEPLHTLYPATSPCTVIYPAAFKLPTVTGEVYCTDETSGSLTVVSTPDHTTIAKSCKTFNLSLVEVVVKTNAATKDPAAVDKVTLVIDVSKTGKLSEAQILDTFPPAMLNITEKSLKEREDHQNKIALDKLRNTNPKASAIGTRVFDKLMKACGDCHWTAEGGSKKDPVNIIIDGSILVVDPYLDAKHVSIKDAGQFDDIEMVKKRENLERIRKIVLDVKEAVDKEKTEKA
jgi:hypothetical protein